MKACVWCWYGQQVNLTVLCGWATSNNLVAEVGTMRRHLLG